MRVKYGCEVDEIDRVFLSNTGVLKFTVIEKYTGAVPEEIVMYAIRVANNLQAEQIMQAVLTNGFVDISNIGGVKKCHNYGYWRNSDDDNN